MTLPAYFRLALRASGLAVGILVSSCASAPPERGVRADTLRARVEGVLERRGLGRDALAVIDNIVRHDSQTPSAAPPVVREVLTRPASAVEVETLFSRAVPAALQRFAQEFSREPSPPTAGATPASLRDLLEAYVTDLAEARRLLLAASGGARIEAGAIARELETELPSYASLRVVGELVDPATIERATSLFLDATARFAAALRAGAGRIRFPAAPQRFDTAIGPVAIGTSGDDVHASDAALIVDPGGNDVYERAPATGGAVSVIVDLSGDDRYIGSDLALHGLSAIVDLSGNDRYAMTGSGLGAAIAGASVVVDLAGDDTYEADRYALGAAAYGLGAVIDLRGNDSYRLLAGGQAFALAHGVALLWDRDGDDTYTATGLRDMFNRGGGLSIAQGTAFGFRNMLGGGIGILRDDRGNDRYEAEMFAQGAGYYYGVGILWDGEGEDSYRAVRYAQGNGVHEAVGVLYDGGGNDRYELSVGVGQGMGLDLAVGLLADLAGDDLYAAPSLAQGAATANGIGVLLDVGGADRWRTGADRNVWGRAQWLRRLPTIGILLYDPARAVFEREGKPLPQLPRSAELGGPFAGAERAHESPGEASCPKAAETATSDPIPLARALLSISPAFAGGETDAAVYASVRERLTKQLGESISGLPADEFNVMWSFGEALRCALLDASAEDAARMWEAMERVLVETPATPFAGAIAGVLRERPAPAPRMQRILQVLDEHPRCGVRAAALSLRAAGAAERAEVARHAQAALRSSCWRLQAQGLKVLEELGVEAERGLGLPSFLRAAAP